MPELTPEQIEEIRATVELVSSQRPARALLALSCDARGTVRLEVERIEGVSPLKIRQRGTATGLT